MVYRQAHAAVSEWISTEDIRPSDLSAGSSTARFERNRVAYLFLNGLIHGLLVRRPKIVNHLDVVLAEIQEGDDGDEDESMGLDFDFSAPAAISSRLSTREAVQLERDLRQVRFVSWDRGCNTTCPNTSL